MYGQVDNVFYKVDRNALIRQSGMFQSMLVMPAPQGGYHTVGSSESDPLFLPQLSGKGAAFDLFVSHATGM